MFLRERSRSQEKAKELLIPQDSAGVNTRPKGKKDKDKFCKEVYDLLNNDILLNRTRNKKNN